MAIPLQRAEALFDFEPTADVELELKKGDVVFVRRTSVGEGWWEGELNGKRGLFPSSFVKMLPVSQGSPVKERPMTPITPRTSKKMFMDALLAPATLTQEPLYDRDKAADIFAPGHADISIIMGPAWDCNPPSLTVAIKHMQTESRFSGMKHTTVFEVETEQLGTCVPRRYKHFLWLYDRMAELFPCISLPPLPVKHFTGLSDGENNEARRRGLEKFLIRIARHPVLASTKLFHEFLTARDEKDWKIGRHLSRILKAKKMFSSPFYCSVKYPPFNVPVHQLSSIEKFSKFSRFLEATVQTLQQSCNQLTTMNADTVTCICMLGRDLQRFSSGLQPVSGAWIVAQRRKHAAAAPPVAVNSPSPLHVSSVAPPRGTAVSVDIDDGSSDDEPFDFDAQWNWRDDKRFAQMAENLHDLAGRMRKFKPLLHRHQEAMDRQVQDTLDDYSGIIHTLPMLVKQHEEAMELFNLTREKETKKDAEEIRQHCDTLNNILLAEFDYFSKTMIDDFEVMAARLLKQQADFHRKLADELEALYRNYMARTFTTHSERDPEVGCYRYRSASDSKDTSSFLKSGSIDLTSSQESTSSEPLQRLSANDNLFEASNTSQTSLTSQTSVKTLTIPGTGVPTYINVELKPRKAESSDSEIDEDLLKPPAERGKPEPYPVVMDTIVKDTPSATETVKTAHLDPPTPFDNPSDSVDCERTLTDLDANDEHSSPFAAIEAIEDDDRERTPSFHNYANLDFAQVHNLLSQASKATSATDDEVASPKGPKKPMPIQRKYKSTTILSQPEDLEDETTPTSGSPVKNPVPKKPAPPVKPPNLKNQDADSTADSAKFQRTWSPKNTSTPNGNAKPLPALSKFLAANSGGSSASEGRTKDDSLMNTASPPPSSTKPRSHTTVERLFSPATPIFPSEKKQPILPPGTRYKSRSRSPSPVETAVDTQPPSQLVKERLAADNEKTAVAPSLSTVTVKKPVLKPHVSDPASVRNRPFGSTPTTTNRTNKSTTYNTYSGRFPRTFVGGASTGSNHNSSSNSNSDQDELMKKLTLRRQRIDEQLAVTTKSTAASYTTSTKTSSPIPKPSPPSFSSKATHRVSAPLGNKSPVAMNNNSTRSGEISSERNSTISTSSSEVIVTYRKLDESPSLTSLSSNGTSYSVDGGGSGGMLVRKTEDTIETNLSKYGIREEGSSYVI